MNIWKRHYLFGEKIVLVQKSNQKSFCFFSNNEVIRFIRKKARVDDWSQEEWINWLETSLKSTTGCYEFNLNYERWIIKKL